MKFGWAEVCFCSTRLVGQGQGFSRAGLRALSWKIGAVLTYFVLLFQLYILRITACLGKSTAIARRGLKCYDNSTWEKSERRLDIFCLLFPLDILKTNITNNNR